ncbi:MAG: type II toxin-antitoxin system RelE/ParE family toxin [Flavipsychrobacter sp.]|nr:type II toxin-antitoxin system RelE/ParE family toxin [Flavipsychrobacter sp.]
MAKFHLTKKAVADLSDIWEYTFDTWSEKQADKYYYMLLDMFAELARKPAAGKKYDEVMAGLLGHTAGRHLIFYRIVSAKEIEILRILHDRMDLRRHMRD